MTGFETRARVRSAVRALLPAALLCLAGFGPRLLRAQGTEWSEATVGSEWDVYARALAVKGLLSDQPWAIRPFSPSVLDQWRASLGTNHPWAQRLPHADTSTAHVRWLRPSVQMSDNTAFAWGYNDGPVWQGKGVNAWVTVGATWQSGRFSARIEPVIEYAQNAAFELEPVPAYATNPYQNPVVPTSIDLPQRMGPDAYKLIAPGNSYIRYDISDLGIGLSTENVFWGPGVKNALLFGPNAAGFPHLFFGSNREIDTPIGSFAAQVIYGQLQQSAYHPPAKESRRLGGGLIATWQPPHTPLTIGLARFYHRFWPTHWTKADLTLPFGAFFSRPQESRRIRRRQSARLCLLCAPLHLSWAGCVR